jgi:sterol desaturase/sphingolipid hydroxylase (fatty acid hydroxylase superfamily)
MYDLFAGLPHHIAETLTDAAKPLLVLSALFFCIGFLAKGRAIFADMRRAAGETSLNLQIMVFNLFCVVPLIVILVDVLAFLIDRYQLELVAPASWEQLPSVAVVLIAIFVGDFAGYWRHRLEHTRLLWPSHAIHHSDTEMTWLTLERFHPINRITTFWIDTSVLLLMGLPPYAVVAAKLFRHYYGYFIHADLPWTFGRLGNIFVSPAMHRWHHAADERFFNANYATVFALFDKIFGTLKVPGPCDSSLGVTDRLAPNILCHLAHGFSPAASAALASRLEADPAFGSGKTFTVD